MVTERRNKINIFALKCIILIHALPVIDNDIELFYLKSLLNTCILLGEKTNKNIPIDKPNDWLKTKMNEYENVKHNRIIRKSFGEYTEKIPAVCNTNECQDKLRDDLYKDSSLEDSCLFDKKTLQIIKKHDDDISKNNPSAQEGGKKQLLINDLKLELFCNSDKIFS